MLRRSKQRRQSDRGPTPGASAISDTASNVIVRASGVCKTYDTGQVRVDALKGVDLVLDRGEMVAVMGPSGCGKTTLLNCLSGLDEITAGEVLIDGVGLAGLSDRERTRYRAESMGFVFQFYNLMPVLSAVENVELALLIAGGRRVMRGTERSRRSTSSAWSTGPHHVPEELSGGERQRDHHRPRPRQRTRHRVGRRADR